MFGNQISELYYTITVTTVNLRDKPIFFMLNLSIQRAWFVLFAALALNACSIFTTEETVNTIHVSEGFEVELVAGPDLVDYPMFATLDETGRLFVFESTGNVYETSEQAIEDPQFRIKLLEDIDGDGRYDKSTIFADHLSFPQGGVFCDGSLIVTSAPDLLKLTDTDGDGIADEREVLLSGWILNVNANSLIGPFQGPDGWLYLTSAIMGFDVVSQEGEQMKGETARIWKVRPDGSGLEWVAAGGMNNPVELTFTPAGEVIGTQTFFIDPQRGLRDAITYWTEGGVYGKKSSNITRDGLPLTGDLMPVVTQYSRTAPSGIGIYRSSLFGEDFKGNYFSAQFNTHQVIRHQLSRAGASFKTEDEVFLWSESEDFHPTDVLEDADGGLLVVETGGWFIKGCPLSQVSKPHLKGGIYRIKRVNATTVEDPYGNDIDWSGIGITGLANFLEDPRPFVSDRAQSELIAQGNQAIEVLGNVISNSSSADARTKAVFGLYRINTNESWEAIKEGFDNNHLEVRVATAKVAGLTGEAMFADLLTGMLGDDHSPVRRQAATALGQIGEKSAVPWLLKAAENTSDRFVDHAIIYALISIDEPEGVLAALSSGSDPVLKTALIALDQMPSGKLNVAQVTAYFDKDSLRETALWVASHHPEWSLEMIGYLRKKLNKMASSEEAIIYGDIIASYCGTEEMQQFLNELLSSGGQDIKLFAMENMKNCQVDPFPPTWVDQIGRLTNNSSDPALKLQAIELIKLRSISGLKSQLNKIIGDQSNQVSLRIAAIDALLSEQSSLTAQQFSLLSKQLLFKESPTIAQQAATVLSAAELSQEQLLHLANEVLPNINPFVLPRLLPAFEGVSDIRVGSKLAIHLLGLPSLDNLTEDYVNELFGNYPPEISSYLNELLLTLSTAHQERLSRILAIERSLDQGNEERGRALYFGKAICYTCHTMQEKGGVLGPDLTAIQNDRSVHDIIEAIVYPSVSFVREYETYKINTTSGEYRGTIQQKTPEMILLGTGPGTSVRILTSDITTIEPSDISMMPQGLDQLVTDQEFADLMAYLLGKELQY